MSHKIWAIVLAAGESKRMGQPKMLLPFGEKTIIENVIAAVLESKVENILVVLGADREAVKNEIKAFPVQTIFNPDFRQGMLSSVQVGFQALPQDAGAALVLLGDQPSVSPLVINKVSEAFFVSEKSIVVPVFQHRRGHPVAIDLKYRVKIQALLPEKGLRQLLHDHPGEILEIPLEDNLILEDIDNIHDYQKAVNNHKKT